MEEPRSRAPSRPLLFLAALALVVAFLDLGARSLHDLDVPRWGTLARETLRGGEWLVPHRYGEIYAYKPPLYLWTVSGLSALAGEVTPFAVRLPSALDLVALVLVAAGWTRARTGSERTGFVAGLLVLSTASLAWLGREARMDMMAGALSFAGAAALDGLARSGGGRGRAAWTGVLLGLGLLTKGPVLLLPPLAVLFLDPSAPLGARVRAARLPTVLGTAVAVALLWFVPATLSAGWEYARTLLFAQAAERLSGDSTHVEGWAWYLALLPLAALPWGPAYLAVSIASLAPGAAGRALGPVRGPVRAGAVLVLLFSTFPTKHVRYLAPVLPLFAMGAAAWLDALLARAARPGWVPARTKVGAALLLAGAGVALAGALAPSPAPSAAVPAAGFLVLGAALVALGRRGGADPAAARAAVVLAVLVATVTGTAALTVLRPRFHLRDNVRLNREVAEHVPPGVPVYTLVPLWPEDLFEGAPDARPARSPEALAAAPPLRPFVVVADEAQVPALDAALGPPERPCSPRPRGPTGRPVSTTPPGGVDALPAP